MTDFRLCSRCLSYSQANTDHYVKWGEYPLVYHCAPPLLFRRPPSQSNSPFINVPYGIAFPPTWVGSHLTPIIGYHLAVQMVEESNDEIESRCTGSFRPAGEDLPLHRPVTFTESLVETVEKSLRHSNGSELTRQLISLP